jgi:hypothetical protein
VKIIHATIASDQFHLPLFVTPVAVMLNVDTVVQSFDEHHFSVPFTILFFINFGLKKTKSSI